MSAKRHFREMIEAKWAEKKFVCVGLDSDWHEVKQTPAYRDGGIHAPPSAALFFTLLEFNKRIVDATHDLVCAYKLNTEFYGISPGAWEALYETARYIRTVSPRVPIIIDGKRGDIENTNRMSALAFFEGMGADAVTVNPYVGQMALEPFLSRPDKGVFVVCRTSDNGSSEFQKYVTVVNEGPGGNMPLWEYVAYRAVHCWGRDDIGLVVGATHPYDLRRVRGIGGDSTPLLIPGAGAQGGSLLEAVMYGKNRYDVGIIVNASRSIIFASKGEDYAEASRRNTKEMHEKILACFEAIR